MQLQEEIDRHKKKCDEVRIKLKETNIIGPWMNEPDRIEFIHNGFQCLALRNSFMFAWCGYVGLPPSHKYYRKEYDEIDVNVHGGLTYSEECQGVVCLKSDNDTLYWVGFDCAHSTDFVPVIGVVLSTITPITAYKDLNFVINEIKQLAEQM